MSYLQAVLVAPYTGAWIEIHTIRKIYSYEAVAPYTGAWIEIKSSVQYPQSV